MRTMQKSMLAVGLFTLAASPLAFGQFAPPPPTMPLQQPSANPAPYPSAYPSAMPPTTPPLAQQSPYPATATIMLSQVDVSSGPGQQYYATSRLRSGDRVIVLGESKKAPGWMEILPPTGSFSWISAQYVKVIPGVDKIGIVDAGDAKGSVPVMPGSTVVNKEPNVEIARVANGAQIFLLDRPSATSAGSWYPIVPVATEIRFVPAEAIRGNSYAGNNPYTSVSTYNPNPGVATNPYPFIALSQQADQALAQGMTDRARLLYLEALSQCSDPAWRNYLTGQLARVSPGASPGTAPGFTPGATNPPIKTIPTYPTGLPSTTPTAATPGAKQWSQWGVLRSPGITARDGQPVYVLTDPKNGGPMMYLTTAPGFSLRDYLNQTVAVYGTLSPQVDEYIRAQILVAEHIATPQPTK